MLSAPYVPLTESMLCSESEASCQCQTEMSHITPSGGLRDTSQLWQPDVFFLKHHPPPWD